MEMMGRFRRLPGALLSPWLPALLACLAVPGAGGQAEHASAQRGPDALWARAYATSCLSTRHACAPSTDGYENAFNGDPRLPGLLTRALPQQESWWVNGHGGSAPVSSIVQEFIGVPGDLRVDEDRYVTATGCVPHDCMTEGMLWIDTGARPARVIFVAEVIIESSVPSEADHLWVYTSDAPRPLPPDFILSLKRWQAAIFSKEFPQTVTLATVVQRNGRMRDFTYDLLLHE